MTRRPAATIVIQSRLASARLPAKALLPIAGLPSVALCALRAANAGCRVIVATSDTAPDDAIAEVVAAAGIECFRGAHDDVLLRFVQATGTLPADAAVVRLTADNLIPDGAFVAAVVEQFDQRAVDYVGTSSPQSGLPYGMSAEVFSVAALRRAERATQVPYDREHVTPWIKRFGSTHTYVHPVYYPHWPRLRCTLDTFEDYRVLLQLFAQVRDPVGIAWLELLERLTALSPGGAQPRSAFRERADGSIHSLLTLGTAQLGSSYGIANTAGLPGQSEIKAILNLAADAGITSIDTAAAYGESERNIGTLLPPNYADRIQITTKLDVLAAVPASASAELVASAIDASVFRSLFRLRRRRIDTLLLHRWAHHDAWGGAAWKRLLELKRFGLIDRLGASVSYPIEAIEALADPDVTQLQCPVNVLDGRWRDAEFLAKAAARADVVIHARSVLLQGMLTLPAANWVEVEGVDAQRLCDLLDELVIRLDRVDRIDLCMAYVAALPWVTSMVVGVESLGQLQANLRYAQAPILSARQLAIVSSTFPPLPEGLLNPALWRNSRA